MTCALLVGFNTVFCFVSDIDECGLIDELYCAGPLDVCFNTIGSFRCDCQQGFQRVNNTCEGNP